MTLIASISGVRGTLGGAPGDNFTPPDIVRFAAAFGTWLTQTDAGKRVVIGRDARPSGQLVTDLVAATLQAMGLDIIDLGLTTTPTVELAVTMENAAGGIVLTASHNPVEWNALKLLNSQGEFLSEAAGAEILALYTSNAFLFVPVEKLGQRQTKDYLITHIDHILSLELVDVTAIRQKNYTVAVDAVNSSGGVYIPELLKALGCSVFEINCEPNGIFSHNPEPLPAHLEELMAVIPRSGCDLGVAVDPDVDRLALLTETGAWFGEEYTLVAVADYVLQNTPGPVVSNLSSSRALSDIAERHGQVRYTSAVGEVNVVSKMKEVGAPIGGEGNGGVIYPPSHYGRDALVGLALFLTHLAKSGKTAGELRASYPDYAIAKLKAPLPEGRNVAELLADFATKHAFLKPTTIDGVKLDWPDRWVHLRKSNTEPIVRVYAEAPTPAEAAALAEEYRSKLLA